MTEVDTARTTRPGWPEILVGLAVMAVLGYGLPITLNRTGISDTMSPVLSGLILAALSGVAGLAAFVLAARLRVRDWSVFGVRRTTRRWLLLGAGAGLLAVLVSRLAAAVLYYVTGPIENIQQPYADAAGGGVLAAILSVLFLAILTPIGEEFLFRGIVTTALLRYGAIAGVVGSSLIFALMHGLNAVFITALIVGLLAAEVRRRSGSVWPGVLTHVVNNLIGQLIVLALAAAA